ncbi:MAG: amidohydrolase family protein [Steroidobacteraceae bacterium]
MRQLRLLLGLVLFLCGAAEAAAQRYVALSNNEVVGTLDVVRSGAGVSINYRIDDNGRGPKLRESLVLDSQGLPSQWRIEGAGAIGAPVKESYRRAGHEAIWRSLNDSGKARADAGRVYVATDSSPWAYGLYLRALLRRPDLQLSALPTGTLKAEKLREITVGQGARSRQVTVYALWGIRTSPLFVLADDRGGFFGTVAPGFVVVLDDYAPEFPQLSQLAASLNREYLERLARRLVHRFDRPIHIQDARVFDSHTGTLGQPTSVVIYRGRIVGVRADAAPLPEDVVVDAQGGTLLPGLTDMHSHVEDWDMPLYLAGGVTTVRDLGNHNDVLLDLEARARAGTIPGPEIIRSGFMEGRSPYSAKMGFVVDQLPAALEKVRWYADHGYSAIKLYSSITPDWVAPISAEAHRLGLRVSGHVPAFMTSERAVRDGYDEINHMNQLLLSFVLSPQEDTRTPLRFTAVGERMGKLDLQSEPVQRMIRLMKERGTTLDVTMAGLEWMLLSQPGKSPPSIEAWLGHMPGPVQRARRTAVLDMKPGQLPMYQAAWTKLLEALKLVYDAGIPIVPGTDDVPGFMLHSELEVYGRAGIPASRVLQMATLGCARYLHRDHEVGSIEPGKLADLLLVDGDPTVDLNALRKVRMVLGKGAVLFPDEVYSTVGMTPFAERPPLEAWR